MNKTHPFYTFEIQKIDTPPPPYYSRIQTTRHQVKMNAVETILANLAAIQGIETVRKACHRFYLGKIPVALDASIADLSDVESSISEDDAPKKRGRPSKEKEKTHKTKEKKERKPRGQTSWNKLVEATLKEMRDAYIAEHPDMYDVYKAEHPDEDEETIAKEIAKIVAKAVPYKIAFEEAGKRKRASDPEAQRLFEEKKTAKQAAKVAKYPPLPISSKTSQTEKTGSNTIYDVDDEHV